MTTTTKIPSAVEIGKTVKRALAEALTITTNPQAKISGYNPWEIRLPGLNISGGDRARVDLVATIKSALGTDVCDHVFIRSMTVCEDDGVRIQLETWMWKIIRDMPLIRLRAATRALYEARMDEIEREMHACDYEEVETLQEEFDVLWAQREQALTQVTEGHQRHTKPTPPALNLVRHDARKGLAS